MFQVQPGDFLNTASLTSGTAGLCDPRRPSSPHTNGMNVGMADGSVRFVSASLSPTTWWIAVVPNDNLPMPSDWDG